MIKKVFEPRNIEGRQSKIAWACYRPSKGSHGFRTTLNFGAMP